MKRISFLLIIAILAASCDKVAFELKHLNKPGNGDNKVQIPNGNFERPFDFNNPEKNGWIKQGYILSAGIFKWENNIGRNTGGGVSIETGGTANDLSIT